MLRGPLQHVRPGFLMLGRADNHSCVGRTCQVSLECSHLVDYKGNSALWGRRLWNCKLVRRCVLFLVHAGQRFSNFWPLSALPPPSAIRNDLIVRSCCLVCILFGWAKIFKFLAIICSTSSLCNKKWSDHALLLSCLHTFWHAIPTIFIVSCFLIYVFWCWSQLQLDLRLRIFFQVDV